MHCLFLISIYKTEMQNIHPGNILGQQTRSKTYEDTYVSFPTNVIKCVHYVCYKMCA